MPKLQKISLGVFIAIILVIGVGYGAMYVGKAINSSLCKNNLLETKNSPDGTKKAIVFVRDCGATTDWSTEASIVNVNSNLSDGDTGNILSINSNNGKTWPLTPKGWPLITTEWIATSSLELYYSEGTSIGYKEDVFNGIQLEYATITPELIQKDDLQVRSNLP